MHFRAKENYKKITYGKKSCFWPSNLLKRFKNNENVEKNREVENRGKVYNLPPMKDPKN